MQENKNAYNLILPALNDKLFFEANCMMIFRLNHSEWSVRLEKCYVNAASFHFIKTVGLVFLMDSNLTNMLNIWWRVQRKLSFLTVGANQRGDSFFFSITTFSFILFSFVFYAVMLFLIVRFGRLAFLFCRLSIWMSKQMDAEAEKVQYFLDVQHSTYRCKMGFISTSNLYLWIVLE